MGNENNLFIRLGGRKTLEQVHKIFYDKVYEHPWLQQFFVGIEQSVIEDQQSDFMMQSMGGGRVYSGKLPIPAHQHMLIDEELFILRHQILAESIAEVVKDSELIESWLKRDSSFHNGIVKKTVSECTKRFNTDEIMVITKPKAG